MDESKEMRFESMDGQSEGERERQDPFVSLFLLSVSGSGDDNGMGSNMNEHNTRA